MKYFLPGDLQRNEAAHKGGKLIRIHPAWYSFIRFCETLRHGEIEKLKIQDGLPMLAEEVRKKIRFSE